MTTHTLNSIGAMIALALFAIHFGPWLVAYLCP